MDVLILCGNEARNSRHPWKPLDDQSTIKEHLMHELLRIDKHKDMTIREIFTQLNCQRRYKKAFKPPLKASNG